MSGLVLKLAPKERVIINGAVIENGDRRTRLSVLTPGANILRLRDAIHPEEANTPVRRVCYVAQLAVSGDAEPDEAKVQLLRGIEQLSQVFCDSESLTALNRATEAVSKGQFYQSLRALRSLLPREERLMGIAGTMTFQPIAPFGGIGGWAFLSQTREAQQEAFDTSASVVRDTAYFEEKIGTISKAEDLVADRRLLRVALGAFGLDGDIDNRFFIQKVLEDSTLEPGSLSNRLSDKRYLAMAQEFGFGDVTPPYTALSEFGPKITVLFRERQFEIAVGNQSEDMRLALGLERDLGDLVDRDISEDAMWFTVMATQPLRVVFERAFSIPTAVGALDIDRQLELFKEKATAFFGDPSVAQFSDPEKLDDLRQRFLAQSELQASAVGGVTTTRGSAALALLSQSNPAGGVSVF